MTLPSGHPMPLVGLGTWKLKADEVAGAIGAALDAGYRHFDCALIYGNEKEVGVALREAMQRLVRRHSVEGYNFIGLEPESKIKISHKCHTLKGL